MSVIHPDDSLTPFPDGWSMPFYYASLSCCWAFHRVDADVLRPFLDGTTLEPWVADGKGVLCTNLQFYTNHNGQFLAVVNEVEFNIICYPKAYEAQVPNISLREFIVGNDQTKLIGGFRVYVPCDNAFAVAAGQLIFGEQKFEAAFAYDVPANNNHATTGNMDPHRTWDYYCIDKGHAPEEGATPAPEHTIFHAHIDTTKGIEQLANHSPMTLYAMLQDDESERGHLSGDQGNTGRLTASRWNMLGVYKAWFLDESPDVKIEMEVGGSSHQMCTDMGKILPHAEPAAVLQFMSPPAAIENRAYYVNPDRS